MKKFTAILLALILVFSLSVTAFAATSEPAPGGDDTKIESPKKDDPVPPVDPGDDPTGGDPSKTKAKADDNEENLFEIRDRATDELVEKIPGTLVPFADAESSLSGSDLESFKSAYDEAQGYEGIVQHFFWLDIGDYVVAPENYLAFNFECEGENVKVFCNGEEVEVVPSYTAKLPSGGSLAIVTD